MVANLPKATALYLRNNVHFQGGLYAIGNYWLANNAAVWGPVIADHFTVWNNSGQFRPLNPPEGGPSFGTAPSTSSGLTLEPVPESFRSYTPS